ncbi:MAG: S8 family serine peptidase [Gemmatimonadota bacterium]
MTRRRVPPFLMVGAVLLAACAEDPSSVTAPESPESPALQVDQQRAPELIPNEYIVVFRRDVADPQGLARQLAEQHGLKVRHTYLYAVKGFSATVPERAVEALRSNRNVDFIEQNAYFYLDAIAAPTNLVATATSESQIGLAWVDNATNEQYYEVYRSSDGPNGTFVMATRLKRNSTSYADGGLAAGAEYCYQVQAASRRETSAFSNVSCATTQGGGTPTPPAAPTALDAVATGQSTIGLSWSDNASNETGYRVERSLGAGVFSAIANLGENQSSFGDSNLLAETEYCYRVFAVNGAGDSDPSNIDCATTQSAPPPGDCPDTGNHDNLSQTGLYGITKVKAHQNPTWMGTQNGGACAIQSWYFGLDSGVDSDHPDLNVVEIRTFLTDGSTGEDENGHGTHTAGTAAARDGNGGVVGVAPGAPIHGFQVCNAGGSCPTDAIVAGIDEVTGRKLGNPGQPMVANMSLGGGISESIDLAVRESVNSGVVYALSAGNGRFGICFRPADAQNYSPARVGDDAINAANGSDGNTKRVNGAITTTSSDESDSDVNCNYGNPVTVAAPGDGVLSTYLGGGTATLSGTSMAAPHAAGAALLYLHSHPGATPTEVEQAIVNDLDPWTTNDLPNADGRLDASGL